MHRLLWAVVLALVLVPGAGQGQPGPRWLPAPAFLPVFTPFPAHREAYRTFVSPLGLDTVLLDLTADAALVRSPGAWLPQSVLPLDAFGRTGAYNRWTLARLYGGSRARVARGARARDGRPVETWTLISPYPDPTLRRLNQGTLLIVLAVDGAPAMGPVP